MSLNPFNLFRRKRKIVTNFNSSDFSNNEKLSALLNENAYLKGQLARIKTEEAKKRESEKDINEEEAIAIELNRQKHELQTKGVKPFSLKKILNYVNKSKKRPKKFPPIHFTTYDAKESMGIVEDFVIMPDGGLGVVSDGNVIWASTDINHVFYWVAGLNNFAKNKIIPLSVNHEHQFQPNLMSEEIEDITLTSDGKFKINKFNRKPLAEAVANLHEEISHLQGELKTEEVVISDQQREIKEKEREASLHKNRADKADSELSMALNKVAEIEKANGEILKQNTALMSAKEINEELIQAMERIIKKWNDKIEDELSDTVRGKEWEDLKSKLEWAKSNMPQTIYNLPEQPKVPSLSDQYKPVKA